MKKKDKEKGKYILRIEIHKGYECNPFDYLDYSNVKIPKIER